MLIQENKRFLSLFKSYLLSLVSPKASNPVYNNSGYSYANSYGYKPSSNTIYFYEWSDLSNRSRSFLSVEKFKEFCEQSNIKLCEHHINMASNRYYVYCTCIPGSSTLMMRNTYTELEEALKMYNEHPIYKN